MDLREKVSSLSGPVLVLGAGGFVGSHLYRTLALGRSDAWGTLSPRPTWRLPSLPPLPLGRLISCELTIPGELERVLGLCRPRLVINTTAYGNVAGQLDPDRTLSVCAGIPVRVLEWIARHSPSSTFLQAGSSSEYGSTSDAPDEESPVRPHSLYGIAKRCASEAVAWHGSLGTRCATLRLYSVFGPLESPDRLIPTLLREASAGRFPPLADALTTRDFIHIDDIVQAFLHAALHLPTRRHGAAFNIGTGRATTLADLAAWASRRFGLSEPPAFGTYPSRPWDGPVWRANPTRARDELGWEARVALEDGLERLITERALPPSVFRPPRPLLSLVIACFEDAPSLGEMHERLSIALERIPAEAEILFVNDGSPDDTEKVLQEISSRDPRVMGITHSRNFGSQAAFRSGLELARGDAIVFLDGDLQDPPELIPSLYERWAEGNEIVYGIRASREEPATMTAARKAFYRLFRWASELPVPLDAGDFGLVDKRVGRALLAMPERDSFLRGLRAYVGFKHVGVSYHRPKRRHGNSTNNWLSNLEWAKRALSSFDARISKIIFLGLLGTAAAATIWASLGGENGVRALLLVAAMQGVALAWMGDKMGRVLSEVKGRPAFLRRRRIARGVIDDWPV